MKLIASLLLLLSSAAAAAGEPGVFLDDDTVVLADDIFKKELKPSSNDLETASNLMRWLAKSKGAPNSGSAYKGVLFNVTFDSIELRADPIDPDAAQAALGSCKVINMNGVSDPNNRKDRRFIAFMFDCGSDHLAVVTMTIQGSSVTRAYIHNNNFVPVMVR